eukprot:m.213643 g.213643  ORF g.213643 m.213643 type:complete len:403 (+) comp19061_c0_seq3:767-1975(+)
MCNFTTGAFRHVYNFARASNARLLFDLSELAGRTCNDSQNCRGPWDTANVRLLLEYVRAEGLFEPNGTLIGFELGNEVFAPPLLLPEAVVADNRLLAAMLHDLFGGTHAAVPLHYAPATNKCGGPENAPVMDNLTNVISGWSFHTYPGGSGTQDGFPFVLNASWLRNKIMPEQMPCLHDWNAGPRQHGMDLIMTETAAVYGRAPASVPQTSSFQHGFFTLASLGQYAFTGVSLVARWQFLSINPGTPALVMKLDGIYTVAHDYYLLVLYRRLVGPGVLNTTAADPHANALVYAHCSADTRNGSVVAMAVNPTETALLVDFAGIGSATPRTEFVLTAPNGNMGSETPVLNGDTAHPLRVAPDGTLPAMDGRYVAADGPGALLLPPRSQAFVVLHAARAPACTA